MATFNERIDVDYDEHNDILYTSIGAPLAMLSYEIRKDIWLNYIPPHQEV